MSSSRKKVVARKWDQAWLSGYLPPRGFQGAGRIELLELSGKVQAIALAELKWICFVRDFNSGEIANPERLLRKTFAGRPRSAGVWVRATLADDDILEGIADNDATLITSQGLFLVPPDTRSNTQRVFLPALAIAGLEILGVIGAPVRPPRRASESLQSTQADQPTLFKA